MSWFSFMVYTALSMKIYSLSNIKRNTQTKCMYAWMQTACFAENKQKTDNLMN